MTRPHIAIAHDYLTQRGGAERVVLALLRAFPGAVVHTTIYDPDETYPEFRNYPVVTSPINELDVVRQDHRLAFPMLAVTSARLRVEADVVIASTSGWAHGFDIVGRRLVYCHAPARWLYQPEEYLGGPVWASPKGWALRALRKPLIRWDNENAHKADRYLCNSHVVRDRIKEEYGIEADVVPPPFGLETAGEEVPIPGVEEWADRGFLLLVARLLPYKNVHQVVEAVRGMPDKLVIIGYGPLKDEIERIRPDNVRLFSHLPDTQMRWAYRNATALLAPSHEDFGLTPLEAAAYGKPTIALRGGGYLDTVREGVTGLFFDAPTVGRIQAAITANTDRVWDADVLRDHAALFSEDVFARRMRAEVDALLPQPV